MENNGNIIDTLLERVTDYGTTSFELVKLKALDKTAEVISSLLSYSVVLVLISSFMLFISLGLAFWLGEILGKIYFGFFIVTAFYGFITIIILLFFQKKIKRSFRDYTIKQMLK